MLIVLFVVSTVFGGAAMVLWALLASTRATLQQAEQLTRELMEVMAEPRQIEQAEWDALAARRNEIFRSRAPAKIANS